jgi:hypothetical protein
MTIIRSAFELELALIRFNNLRLFYTDSDGDSIIVTSDQVYNTRTLLLAAVHRYLADTRSTTEVTCAETV